MKPSAALLLEALRDTDVRAELAAIATEHSAPAPSAGPRLVDRRACADALSCSLAALDRLRAEPGFPELSIGEAPRFELERVIAWLRARTEHTEPGGLRVVGGRRD